MIQMYAVRINKKAPVKGAFSLFFSQDIFVTIFIGK